MKRLDPLPFRNTREAIAVSLFFCKKRRAIAALPRGGYS
jgi:hypothetical protein